MSKIHKYQNVQVMTADKVRIIILLYEGIIRFNKGAQQAIKNGEIELRNNAINRSIAIITELCNSLDMEKGGNIAQNLLSLYQFSIEHLTRANLNNNPRYIEAVNKVINELKSGWEHIAAERPDGPEQPGERGSLSHGA